MHFLICPGDGWLCSNDKWPYRQLVINCLLMIIILFTNYQVFYHELMECDNVQTFLQLLSITWMSMMSKICSATLWFPGSKVSSLKHLCGQRYALIWVVVQSVLILHSLTAVLEGVEGRSKQRKEHQGMLTPQLVVSLLVTLERDGMVL